MTILSKSLSLWLMAVHPSLSLFDWWKSQLLYFDIFSWNMTCIRFSECCWECNCSIYQGVLLSIRCSYFRFICTQWNNRITSLPFSFWLWCAIWEPFAAADYNMLEDVKRFAESSRRMRQRLCGYAHFKLPLPLKNLRRAATRRRTKIQFLSSGMSKREKNQTYYDNRWIVDPKCLKLQWCSVLWSTNHLYGIYFSALIIVSPVLRIHSNDLIWIPETEEMENSFLCQLVCIFLVKKWNSGGSHLPCHKSRKFVTGHLA